MDPDRRQLLALRYPHSVFRCLPLALRLSNSKPSPIKSGYQAGHPCRAACDSKVLNTAPPW